MAPPSHTPRGAATAAPHAAWARGRTLALGLVGALAACRGAPATARDDAAADVATTDALALDRGAMVDAAAGDVPGDVARADTPTIPVDAVTRDDVALADAPDATLADVPDVTLDARDADARDAADATPWDAPDDAVVDVASVDRAPADAARDAADVSPVWSLVEVPASRVFAGFGVTFLAARDGSFWGWGWNADATFPPAALRYGYDDVRVRPQRLAEHLEVRQMTFRGLGGICALAGPESGGTVWCWGIAAAHTFSLPGDTWAQWSFPHQLGTHSDVLGLSSPTSCIRSDHSYWAMRQRDSDWVMAPGLGSLVGRLLPAPDPVLRTADGVSVLGVPSYYDTSFQRISGVVDVVTGLDHQCLLRIDGHVMCWGNNTGGQTGNGFDGSEVCRYTEGTADRWTNCVRRPTEVPGLDDVVRVSAGTLRTCALRRDGTVWCWGQDERFRDGTSVAGFADATDEVCIPFESATVRHPESAVYCRRRPTQIPGITDAVDLSVGTSHACVVRAGGQVLCWGDNGGGQLGDGTTHYRSTPTPVRWY